MVTTWLRPLVKVRFVVCKWRCQRLRVQSITSIRTVLQRQWVTVKTPGGIKAVFGEAIPRISSTKSMSGHSLGAAGVHGMIYCLLMMQGDFIAPSINITELDEAVADMPIVQQRRIMRACSASCRIALASVALMQP